MEDTLYPFLNIYRLLPDHVQAILGRAYRRLPSGLRYGPFYDEYRRRIQNFMEESNLAVVQGMQLDLLRETVNRAVEYVPFYRQFSKIKTLDDLFSFPIVDKKYIIQDPKAFLSNEFSGNRLKANTGGSAGKPMEFFLHSGRTRPKEQAHFDWFWGQYGFVPGARILMIRGAPLKNNALYEYQSIKNCLAISCYELNSFNVGEALQAVKKFCPQFIHGYPSAVKNFIRCIEENANAMWDVPITTLFLGSEWLSRDDRIAIESFFNSKVLAWYGHTECAAMGGNSLDSSEFFFYPFYGYAELLDENDMPVTTPGQVGRIVATSFDNYVMPFIRYATDDFGVLSNKNTFENIPCLVLSGIEGRKQNFIYLNDNTRVSLTAFIFGQHLAQFAKISEMQLEQRAAGRLLLRIVPGKGYGANDEQEMVNRLQKSVSGKIEIECEYVKQIEKTHRGKHRFLLQRIKDLP